MKVQLLLCLHNYSIGVPTVSPDWSVDEIAQI